MANSSKGNVYYKPTGPKVLVPSRLINSKQTIASETSLGKAMDTGRGRGPLRGVARRAREGADLESTKYKSQDVAKKSARNKARTAGKIDNGSLKPPATTPVKRSSVGRTRIGNLAGGARGGMGGGMNWSTK